MNAATLDLTTRKVKRQMKRRESPQHCVYSVGRAAHHNQHHLSLQAESAALQLCSEDLSLIRESSHVTSYTQQTTY